MEFYEVFEPMPDIPWVYKALAEWVACAALIYTVPRRYRGVKQGALLGAALLMQCACLYFTEKFSSYLWISGAVISVLVMIGSIHIQTVCRLRGSAYLGLEAFVISEATASMGWQIEYFLKNDYRGNFEQAEGILFLILMYLLVFLFCRWLFRMTEESRGNFYVTRQELGILVMIASFCFLLSNLTFTDFYSPFRLNGYDPVASSLVRTLVNLSGMMTVCFFHMERKQFYAREELNMVKNVLQNQYIQYQRSKESIELINIKYHDLKHQIAYLKEMNQSPKNNEMLTQIENEIHVYETQNETGNEVVDTILTSKGILCEKKQITLNCVVDGQLLDFMRTADICGILGNALDNAVEAVEKIQDVQKRLIHVAIFSQKAFVILRFENYYEGQIEMKEGMPVTTKPKQEYHGFGVKSICMTAEKYGGTVSIESKNNWFRLQVLLPFRENDENK